MSDTLDLRRRAWLRRRGGLAMIGSWLWQEEHGRYMPCMVLIRERDEYSDHVVPCIITMDAAWMWDEVHGDIFAAGKTLGGFLAALRMEPDDRTILKTLSFIRDCLGDLISIPPMPADMRAVMPIVAELTVTDDAGSERHVELRDV